MVLRPITLNQPERIDRCNTASMLKPRKTTLTLFELNKAEVYYYHIITSAAITQLRKVSVKSDPSNGWVIR